MKFSNLTRQRVLTMVLMGALGLNMSWRILGHMAAIEMASQAVTEEVIELNGVKYKINAKSDPSSEDRTIVDGTPAEGGACTGCTFATVIDKKLSNIEDLKAPLEAYLHTRNAPVAQTTAPAPVAKVEDHNAFPKKCTGKSGATKLSCLADYLVEKSLAWSCTSPSTKDEQALCDDDRYNPDNARIWVTTFYNTHMKKEFAKQLSQCLTERKRNNQSSLNAMSMNGMGNFGMAYNRYNYRSMQNSIAGFDTFGDQCEGYEELIGAMNTLITGLERDSGSDVKTSVTSMLDRSFVAEAAPANQLWQASQEPNIDPRVKALLLQQYQIANQSLYSRYMDTTSLLGSDGGFNPLSFNPLDSMNYFQNGFQSCVSSILSNIQSPNFSQSSSCGGGTSYSPLGNSQYGVNSSVLGLQDQMSFYPRTNAPLRGGSGPSGLSTLPQATIDPYNLRTNSGSPANTFPSDRFSRGGNQNTEATFGNGSIYSNSQGANFRGSGIPQPN